MSWERIEAWIFSDTAAAAVAGALGGLVRWITLKENWKEGATTLIVGAICAVYLGPLIAPVLEPVIGQIAPHEGAVGFTAFLTGIGGISLSALIIDAFRLRHKTIKGDADE